MRSRHFTCSIAVLVLASQACFAQSGEISAVRFGIGHEISESPLIVGGQLPLWQDGAAEVEVSLPPTACTQGSVIDGVTTPDGDFQEDVTGVDRTLFLVALLLSRGHEALLQCGNETAAVGAVLEARSDDVWSVYNGYDDPILNTFVPIWARLRLTGDTFSFETLDDGGIAVSMSGDLVFGFGIRETVAQIVVASDEEDFEAFQLLIERLGYEDEELDFDLGDGRVWTRVALDPISATNFMDVADHAVSTALRLRVASLDIGMARLEAELERTHGSDWLEEIYREHFPDQ